MDNLYAPFQIKPWSALTEPPNQKVPPADTTGQSESKSITDCTPGSSEFPKPPKNLSANAMKLLWDILCYMFSSISVRIKRMAISVRIFENAAHELEEKGLIIRSSAGQTIYLIPQPKAFAICNVTCPYQRATSIEHAYYVSWHSYLFAKDVRIQQVLPEYKIGDKGCAADLCLLYRNGNREAVEVFLNTSNLLSTAQKYHSTNFSAVLFSFKNYALKEAAKASVVESELTTELLVKFDYIQFSTLLNRYRKMYSY